MSTDSVTQLLEQANELIEEWDGTIMAALLHHDIEIKDYDQLHIHIKEAKQLETEREYAGTY